MVLNEELTNCTRERSLLSGLEETPYIACLVYNKKAGTRIIGLNYTDRELNLDLLAGFFSAIDTVSEDKLIGVRYKAGIAIWFVKGKTFDVTMVTEAQTSLESDVRAKLLNLINILEANKHVVTTTENRTGDMRPYLSHTYEIVKRFPIYKISGDFWDLYHPICRHSIKEVEERIEWCRGKTHDIFYSIMAYLNGKRSVTEIVNAAQTEDIDETDILTIMTTLYHYRLLEFIPIYTPDRMFLKRIPTASVEKMAATYGEQLQRILDECDGRKNILEISTDLNIPYESLNFVVKQMIVEGLVKIQIMRG